MSHPEARGFTLVEVVLAIAVGLIIIAGVSVGYRFTKRAVIKDAQRKNVEVFKAFVEQAIASQQADLVNGGGPLHPPALTYPLIQALAERVPSMKFDPYDGRPRSPWNGEQKPSFYIYEPPISDTIDGLVSSPLSNYVAWPSGTGTVLAYAYASSFRRVFTVNTADGSAKTCYGYYIVETDDDGNFIAVTGGDPGLQSLSPLAPK